jgi:hypothetical protein
VVPRVYKQIVDCRINSRGNIGVIFVEIAIANEGFYQPTSVRHPKLDEIAEVRAALPLNVGLPLALLRLFTTPPFALVL